MNVPSASEKLQKLKFTNEKRTLKASSLIKQMNRHKEIMQVNLGHDIDQQSCKIHVTC